MDNTTSRQAAIEQVRAAGRRREADAALYGQLYVDWQDAVTGGLDTSDNEQVLLFALANAVALDEVYRVRALLGGLSC